MRLDFSWQHSVQQYLNLYEGLLPEKEAVPEAESKPDKK